MSVMSCRTAQRCLQARADLDAGTAAELSSHLTVCAACRDVRDKVEEIDRLVHQHIDASGRLPSVRGEVLARIEALEVAPASGRGLFFNARAIRRIATLPVLLAGLLVALLFPTNLEGVNVQPAGAVAFPVVRASIGFPFALDPTLANHLLAGADGQVYESYDGGNTWRMLGALPPHLVIRALAIDRAHPNRYLVAVLRSIYVSDDRGRHWRPTAQALLGAMNMFLIQDPHVPSTFYVGPSVLWKSVDGGNTWRRTGKGLIFAPYGIQALAVGPDNTLATGIWGGGVGLSRDGGTTWKRDSLGLASGVLDVASTPSGSIWAATSQGVYVQAARGRKWVFRGPARSFHTTTVLSMGHVVLAGGDGGLFRSDDGGTSWSLSTNGLPMAPYINSVQADPFHPGRIYASLDADGIFRSDDGGRTWTSRNAGIPLGRSAAGGRLVLFLRGGALWHTDTDGTDPGVLTLDDDVRAGVLTPDGVGASYVAGVAEQWVVREVAAGGSAARDVVRLRWRAQPAMTWSPDSALLAVTGDREVVIARRSGALVRWRLTAADRVLGWSLDSRSLLVWNAETRTVSAQSWRTGRTIRITNTDVAATPTEAPDHVHIAWIQGNVLRISALDRRQTVHAFADPGCSVASWTVRSAEVLATCGRSMQAWSVTGAHVATLKLAGRPVGVLAGDSPTQFLAFTRGGLWKVSRSGTAQRLVREAWPA